MPDAGTEIMCVQRQRPFAATERQRSVQETCERRMTVSVLVKLERKTVRETGWSQNLYQRVMAYRVV